MNPRIIADIVAVLEALLPHDLYAHDFTQEHYSALLNQLNIDTNEVLFNDKKGSIRNALVRFFSQSYQDVDVKVSFGSFSIKKQYIDPAKPETYDRMLHANNLRIVELLKRKYEFAPLPYIISIPEELRIPIMQGFIDAFESMDTARLMTRRQVESIFQLDERDIIFFLRGRITIRYYTPPKKLPPGVDKRFAGESVERMEEMYNNYFPNGAWEHIEPILGEVIAEKLNFSVIDNVTFTRTFIPVFRSMIEILLLEIVDPDHRDSIEGFTGYVFRQHFHPIFIFTAKVLLDFIENRNKNAENFIKYYNEDVIIDTNGNKIQKYAIIDSKQQKWNYSSIVSVMMQYKQAKIKLASQADAIQAALLRVNECNDDLASEKNHKQELLDKISQTEESVSEIDASIVRVKNKSAQTPEEEVSLKSEITKLNYRHGELMDMKKNLLNQVEMVKNRISNKTSELLRRQSKHDYEKKMLSAYQEQTAPIMETYGVVTEAIASVLTKR